MDGGVARRWDTPRGPVAIPEGGRRDLPERSDLRPSLVRRRRATARTAHAERLPPVLIYEGSLKPSQHARSKPDRQADFFEIPFSEDELPAVGGSDVGLTVALSYLAEPTELGGRPCGPRRGRPSPPPAGSLFPACQRAGDNCVPRVPSPPDGPRASIG